MSLIENWKTNVKVVFLCIISLVYRVPADATSVGLDFYSQCPLLLHQVPSVSKECALRGRPWEEIYDDGPEKHSAYLVVPSSGSNFAIGCTLDGEGKIQYLGVYYTLDSDNFKYANSAPVAFIDFDGNFGVFTNSGLANFIAIRRFSIDPKLADPYYVASKFTTCSKPDNFPKGAIPDAYGYPYYIWKKRLGQEVWITGCDFPGACDPSQAYLEIAKNEAFLDDSEIIYTPTMEEAGSFYITEIGGALLPAATLKSDCPIYVAAQSHGEDLPFVGPNLIREECLSKRFRLRLISR